MENEINFNALNLNESLVKTLEQNGFITPTEIQKLTIGEILSGKDIFALAKTGSGKTGSFAIPVLNLLFQDENKKAIVLSPTRELSQQTFKFFELIGNPLGIKSASIIGGEKFDSQIDALTKGARVVIATPGRLVDLIKQNQIKANEYSFLIFDEADRLFDMGFKKEIDTILRGLPKSRQLIMVSATTNREVIETAYRHHSIPVEISLSEDSLLVEKIDHSLAMVSSEEKMPLLVKLLRENSDIYAMIFCNTQVNTHQVAEWLRKMDFKAKPISGRLPQNKRTSLMEEFRKKDINILVCTDVAARGLDIKDIDLVINYDMPKEAANYVHRIGRTGRAGKTGRAISFCAFEDCDSLDSIYELIGEKIPKLDLTDSSFEKNIPSMPKIDYKTLRLKEEREPMNKRNAPTRQKSVEKKVVKNREPKDQIPKIKAPKEFIIESYSLDEALKRAVSHFKVRQEKDLFYKITKEGGKKFFFFGPKKVTYHFSKKENVKEVLLPFFIELLRLANLKLYVQIFEKNENVSISFKGQDEGLLKKNNNELIFAFEQITKTFLARKFPGENRIKCTFEGVKQANNSKDDGLIALVDKLKKKVLDTKESQFLKPLNPAERRIVHQHLDQEANLKTISIGEGHMKKIEISYVNP